MPLTLSAPAYATGMANKGVPADVTQAHYLRMTRFKAAFLAAHPGAWRRGHMGGGGDFWSLYRVAASAALAANSNCIASKKHE